MSLVLSHSCRCRKRLISSISSRTFFEIIRLARCEYSQHNLLLTFVSTNVNLTERMSVYHEENVRLFSKVSIYSYSIKKHFCTFYFIQILTRFLNENISRHLEMILKCENISRHLEMILKCETCQKRQLNNLIAI